MQANYSYYLKQRKTDLILNMKISKSLFMIAALALVVPSLARAQIAVWLDGSLTDGGNPIASRINALSLGGATLVTTAQLETPGFLNAYHAIVVSRYDASLDRKSVV